MPHRPRSFRRDGRFRRSGRLRALSLRSYPWRADLPAGRKTRDHATDAMPACRRGPLAPGAHDRLHECRPRRVRPDGPLQQPWRGHDHHAAPPMSATAKDLLGAWRLESWSFVYDDGRPQEYPLGRDAEGIIIYTPGGQVSATLMRGARVAKAPGSEVERAAAFADSFAY